MNWDKPSLRRQLQDRRRAMPATERQAKSLAIVERAMAQDAYLSSQRIGAYYPIGSEVDTRPLLNQALAQGKTLYLPQVQEKQKVLLFVRYAQPEPQETKKSQEINNSTLQARQLDLIFVPLLGFDRRGYRLGRGGGHYDASLPASKPRPPLIGLAFDCQALLQDLPTDDWDLPLDAIVTESRVLWVPVA